MLTKRRVIAAKIEAVEGTAETLAAEDGGILVANLKHDVDIQMYKRQGLTGSFSNLQEIPGGRLCKVSFQAEVKGPGAAYSSSVLPALGKYLRACGFSVTVVTTPGSETATYKPASSGIPCLTMAVYEDGTIIKMRGARGTVKFSGKKGEPLLADFAFTGVLDSITDAALIAPTFEDTIPPVLLSSDFTVAGYAPVMSSIDIDMACVITPRDSMNSADGYLSALYTDRYPVGKIDPEMTTVAAHDWYGRWKNGTPGAISMGAIGATQYNKFTVTAPKAVYTKVSDEDRSGIAVAGTDFQLAMDTGDDELVIEFS